VALVVEEEKEQGQKQEGEQQQGGEERRGRRGERQKKPAAGHLNLANAILRICFDIQPNKIPKWTQLNFRGEALQVSVLKQKFCKTKAFLLASNRL
jgi:hypothetical protein